MSVVEESLSSARNLVLEYSELVKGKDLEAILGVLSAEISIQVPDFPTLSGKDQLRQFYEQRFSSADYAFSLDITDEKVVSDLVFINGIIHRTISGSDNNDVTDAMDFSFILKKEEGELKIWQMRVV